MSEYNGIYLHKKIKIFLFAGFYKTQKFSTKFCADILYWILPTAGNKFGKNERIFGSAPDQSVDSTE
jgi:hypothetical protein